MKTKEKKCTHPANKVHAEQTGSIRIVAGEIVDDQKIVWVCECGEVLGDE